MNCSIIYIHDQKGLIKKLVVLDGESETVGKYIKSNVKELYHYYMTIALNVISVDKKLTTLEIALKKAFVESFPHGYRSTKGLKKTFIRNIEINLKPISELDLINDINLSHVGNNIVKVVNYTKTLGKKSSIYDYVI